MPDNGKDKIDTPYINTTLGGIVVDTFITQKKSASPNRYAFVHINEPDDDLCKHGQQVTATIADAATAPSALWVRDRYPSLTSPLRLAEADPDGDGLSKANGQFRSIHGLITSSWSSSNGAFTMSTRIPANTTATVHVPTQDMLITFQDTQPGVGLIDRHFSRAASASSFVRCSNVGRGPIRRMFSLNST